MKAILSIDVLNDVYVGLCNAIKNDTILSELMKDEVTFDYEPMPKKEQWAVDTPIHPKKKPKLTVIPTSMDYDPDSSCGGLLTLGYDVELDNYHIRDMKRNQIAWRLLYFFRYCSFTCMQIDDVDRNVLVQPESSGWDFDTEKQTMLLTIPISVEVRV